MTTLTRLLCAAGLVLAAAPALAEDEMQAGRAMAVPAQLTQSERDNYRAVFAALAAQDWAGAAGRLDGMRSGPLHDVARAALYTMPGSPRVELQPLAELLQRAPDLPQADDIARLARARGAETLPDIPRPQRLSDSPASRAGPARALFAATPSPTRSSP